MVRKYSNDNSSCSLTDDFTQRDQCCPTFFEDVREKLTRFGYHIGEKCMNVFYVYVYAYSGYLYTFFQELSYPPQSNEIALQI